VAVRVLALAAVSAQGVPGGECIFHGDFEHAFPLAGRINSCFAAPAFYYNGWLILQDLATENAHR